MSTESELPEGWATARVRELVKLSNGRAFKPTDWKDSGMPIIRIQNLNNPEAPFNYCPDELPEKFRVHSGDVLFAWSGTPGTSFGAHIWRGPTAWLNQHIFKVAFDRNRIDDRFLRLAINQNLESYIRQAHGGAGLAHITKGMFEESELLLAPLNEQRRIVAKVEELFSDLDAGVAALNRAKANLKRYRAAVLKAAVEGKLTEEWRAKHSAKEPASTLLVRILKERRQKWEADQIAKFAAAQKVPPTNWKEKYVEPTPPVTTGLPELPGGWCWVNVDQTSEVQGGIQKQPKRVPGAHSFPFLRVANVHRNRLDLDEVHRIELFGNELERLRLQANDLLVVEGNGSKTEIGRSAIWKGEIENCVHQNHIIRVRFLAGSSRYLNAYWNSPSGNGRVMEQAASTSGLYTLSVTKVCSLPIPLAPLIEQEQIVAEVEQRLSVIAAAETEIEHGLVRASRLRQSILKLAFEGKLVAQDPADEPAAALLARIAADYTAPSKHLAIAKDTDQAKDGKRKEPKGIYFRRGAVASYVIDALKGSNSFGRTQLEKVLHLTQSHLNVDLALEFKRDAAGPFDEVIYKLESLAQKQNWFVAKKQQQQKVTYLPGNRIDERCSAATAVLGEKKAELDALLGHFLKMKTDQAELFATVYAAWNDLLIEGRNPDDRAIIEEVYGWHESKKLKFTEDRIVKCIEWMREQGYVPRGLGAHTIVSVKKRRAQRVKKR